MIARAFTDPDASGRSRTLAAYLDTVGGMLAEHKRASIDAMGLRPGDAGLDVGCGTGDEVRLIAERVGASVAPSSGSGAKSPAAGWMTSMSRAPAERSAPR